MLKMYKNYHKTIMMRIFSSTFVYNFCDHAMKILVWYKLGKPQQYVRLSFPTSAFVTRAVLFHKYYSLLIKSEYLFTKSV